MYHPTVKGTYYEMGHTYGTLLYNHGFRVPEQSDEKLNHGKKSEAEVRRIFPEILEEIQGFADGCHVPYEHFAAFMLSVGAFKVEPLCSVFAAFNGSDTVVGRNYDFFYSFRKFIESYVTCPKGGFYSVGHTDIFIGREDGVNEKGVAIAMTGVAEKVIKPGINFPLIIRCVLDTCESVEESVNVLSKAHFSSASNYLVADKRDMAVVEASAERVRVRRPDDHFIVCTNHFVHPEMQEMEDLKEREGGNWDSIPRYKTIHEALKGGRITVEDAQRILKTHTGYVCSHQEKIKLGTIWSLVLTLQKPEIFRAEGHPCRAKFAKDSRLEKALKRRL